MTSTSGAVAAQWNLRIMSGVLPYLDHETTSAASRILNGKLSLGMDVGEPGKWVLSIDQYYFETRACIDKPCTRSGSDIIERVFTVPVPVPFVLPVSVSYEFRTTILTFGPTITIPSIGVMSTREASSGNTEVTPAIIAAEGVFVTYRLTERCSLRGEAGPIFLASPVGRDLALKAIAFFGGIGFGL